MLLPASVGGALANIGDPLAGQVPVNLNFTAGREAMAAAIEQCGIRTVVTSQSVPGEGQDRSPAGSGLPRRHPRRGRTRPAKLLALAARRGCCRLAADVRGATPDSLATVIFSSGSTGVPKGVMLSHHNVLSNIDAIGAGVLDRPDATASSACCRSSTRSASR